MYTLKALPCRDDNYIWILHNTRYAWVIDPSLAAPVLDYIAQHQLILADILITHHHYDHTEGIYGLLPRLQGKVVGHSRRISQLTHQPALDSTFELSFSSIQVQLLASSGHTYDHVAYFLPDTLAQPLLFCGDTIFSAGCGRIFDGTIEQLFDTFQKLMQLPDETWLVCAHEYTLSNLKFALAVDNSHEPTQEYNNQVKYAREHDEPSVPTQLILEKNINPYMRSLAFDPNWIQQLTEFSHRQGVTQPINTPFDAFKICRMLKDAF